MQTDYKLIQDVIFIIIISNFSLLFPIVSYFSSFYSVALGGDESRKIQKTELNKTYNI